jgi:hypothetical protein|tara:strand:- start:13816 stop:14148 length:333 start_codon:yes stop_codon:yes gene_type:complete
MAETEVPKADGDILFDGDFNKIHGVFSASEQETLSATQATSSVSYSAEADYHIIRNMGNDTVYVNFDAAATTSDVPIKKGEYKSFQTNATAIHGICDTGETGTIRIIGFR